LLTWGRNDYGQLGNNSLINTSSPAQTSIQTTDWIQTSAGMYFAGAIKQDRSLYMWGKNNFGQIGINGKDSLGIDTSVDASSPVQFGTDKNWSRIECGGVFSIGIKTDGTLWSWGYNYYGALGDGTNINRSSPVQTITTGTNWKSFSCGMNHAAGIKTDGTLWTWGWNFLGCLGDNTVIHRSSPVQTYWGGTNWKQVSCGDKLTGGVKTDGTLWMWGNGIGGAIGDNSSVSKSVPTQTIIGGTSWSQVSVSKTNAAAIKSDGTLWIWGYNQFGELGNNSVIPKSSPVETSIKGTNWSFVSVSNSSVLATKSDTTLWAWGNNIGNLGDGTLLNRSNPIQISDPSFSYIDISAGMDVSAAIGYFTSPPTPPTPTVDYLGGYYVGGSTNSIGSAAYSGVSAAEKFSYLYKITYILAAQLDYNLQNAVGVSDGTRWGYIAGGRINNDPTIENFINILNATEEQKKIIINFIESNMNLFYNLDELYYSILKGNLKKDLFDCSSSIFISKCHYFILDDIKPINKFKINI
jgi:alpha-tubulin suppressor-like RCC1 family protein